MLTICGRQYKQDIFETTVDGLTYRDAIVLPVEEYNGLSAVKVEKLKEKRMDKYIPRTDRVAFGMATHLEWLSDAELEIQLTLLQEMGCKYVRNDFSIAKIEQIEGNYDWTRYDKVVNACTAHGIEMIALMDQYNTLSWQNGGHTGPNGTWSMYPVLPQYYETWCEETAKHYKGIINIFEMGNEPDGITFWPPYPDPVAYTELLKAGYTGTKKGNPDAIVLYAGLAGSWTVPISTFLPESYKAGAKGHFDAMALHPYTRPSAPSFSLLDISKKIMEANGDEDLPVYITEVGWPTGSSASSVSEATQATYLKQLFNLANSKNYKNIKLLCWYDFKDDGTDLANSENNYGLIHNNKYSTPYLPKPSYTTYQQLSKI